MLNNSETLRVDTYQTLICISKAQFLKKLLARKKLYKLTRNDIIPDERMYRKELEITRRRRISQQNEHYAVNIIILTGGAHV